MSVYYYQGGFPEGFRTWWRAFQNDPRTPAPNPKPLIDAEGRAAMIHRGRLRVRSAIGNWESLGYNHWTGGDYYNWVELQTCNKAWLSSRVLEQLFNGQMPPAEQEYVILPADEKYRQIESVARRQQSQWAKAIKALATGKCRVTGSTLALEAAHIKPFAICSAAEAVALSNGVCLTATVHKLFDSISSVDDIPKDDPMRQVMNLDALAELIARRNKMNAHD